MSPFQWFVLAGLAAGVLCLMGIASALDRVNRHLSNIADRLLDIDRTMRGRPE